MARIDPSAAGVLVDTGVLMDYLAGDPRARRIMEGHYHRSISVITWLEIMSACPPHAVDETRGFLRTFEQLSISESSASEACRLIAQTQTPLPLNTALTWATARANKLVFVTADAQYFDPTDPGVSIVYDGTP